MVRERPGDGPRLVAHLDRRARTDHRRARSFGRPDRPRPAVAPGALLLDRQCAVLRSVCARSLRDDDVAYRAVRRSLDRVRHAGTCVAVATHNRGESWDGFDVDELAAMDARIEAALGPVDVWCVWLVGADGRCGCDLPGSGVLDAAAQSAGVAVSDCAVVAGDGRLRQASDRAGATTLPGGGPPGTGTAPAGDEATAGRAGTGEGGTSAHGPDERGAERLARALDLVAAAAGATAVAGSH